MLTSKEARELNKVEKSWQRVSRRLNLIACTSLGLLAYQHAKYNLIDLYAGIENLDTAQERSASVQSFICLSALAFTSSLIFLGPPEAEIQSHHLEDELDDGTSCIDFAECLDPYFTIREE